MSVIELGGKARTDCVEGTLPQGDRMGVSITLQDGLEATYRGVCDQLVDGRSDLL